VLDVRGRDWDSSSRGVALPGSPCYPLLIITGKKRTSTADDLVRCLGEDQY